MPFLFCDHFKSNMRCSHFMSMRKCFILYYDKDVYDIGV